MNMKNEENPKDKKNIFKIKAPSHSSVRMPSPPPEARPESWFSQNKMKFLIIAVVLAGLFLAGKVVVGLFKSSKPSLSEAIKEQQQAA